MYVCHLVYKMQHELHGCPSPSQCRPLTCTLLINLRDFRVLRDSCHGQMSWDRTNSATHRTAVESIPNKGPHPVAHARAVAPWQVNSTSSHAGENPGKGHWREWQSNPEARFDQSPRSQRRLMTAKQLFHRQMSAQESKMGPIRAEVAQHHQAAQTPWREGYTSPRVVARPSAGQWTPAGRGVLGGWYTPRMSESDRQAAHDEAVLSEAGKKLLSRFCAHY
eukprot:SAG31_NODE_4907_length_2874_cov_4.581982_1_plen_221_part_00